MRRHVHIIVHDYAAGVVLSDPVACASQVFSVNVKKSVFPIKNKPDFAPLSGRIL